MPTREEIQDFVELETQKLIKAYEDAGLKVIIRSKRDGYLKWWERFASAIAKAINKDYEDRYISTFSSPGEIRIYWNAKKRNGEPDMFDPRHPNDFSTLSHELTHGGPQTRGVFGDNWFSIILHWILYLLILPVVFTFRSVFERQAYRESLRVHCWLGRWADALRMFDWLEDQFSKIGTYGAMDPIWKGGFRKDGELYRQIQEKEIDTMSSPHKRFGYEPTKPPWQ